jgi:hypothetical protein
VSRTTSSTARPALDLRVHVAQRVGERGVDQRDRPRDVLIRADGAQLEAIAAPRERRGAVAVLVAGGDRLHARRDAQLARAAA